MFKKDSKSKPADSKPPTSFSHPITSVIPKNGHSGSGAGSHTTLIAQDTEIFGDVKFSGTLEIEGVIVGNITSNPNAEASVRIQEIGRVDGDVRAPKVVINGHVKGTVLSSTLELAPKAIIEGNVHYSTIEMMKGAQVNGNLVHSDNAMSQSKASPPASIPNKIKKNTHSVAD